MANEPIITVVGNMVADPELRWTPNGAAVASFAVASTPRTFDRQSNEWKDGETLFLRCSIWREAAENVAESLTKGMRVVAQGALKQRSYEKDGQTRTVYEMDVQEIGPSLKYATAKVTRSQPGGAPNYSSVSAVNAAQVAEFGANQNNASDPWTGQQQQGEWVQPSQGPAPF